VAGPLAKEAANWVPALGNFVFADEAPEAPASEPPFERFSGCQGGAPRGICRHNLRLPRIRHLPGFILPLLPHVASQC